MQAINSNSTSHTCRVKHSTRRRGAAAATPPAELCPDSSGRVLLYTMRSDTSLLGTATSVPSAVRCSRRQTQQSERRRVCVSHTDLWLSKGSTRRAGCGKCQTHHCSTGSKCSTAPWLRWNAEPITPASQNWAGGRCTKGRCSLGSMLCSKDKGSYRSLLCSRTSPAVSASSALPPQHPQCWHLHQTLPESIETASRRRNMLLLPTLGGLLR